jgi:4-amino-4-deoxy-L-arabinose transferase-like glycosyltransferase
MTPQHELCAYFPPVYPTLLAAGILTGHARTAIVILSSLIGAGTVAMTFLLGRLLFGPRAGLLAAFYASVYPYYVWHDAVIQENASLALIITGTVFLLIRANRSMSCWLAIASGAGLALSVLTKANLLVFVPMAIFWTAVFAPGGSAFRFRQAACTCLGVALLLTPWIIRTWRVVGAPILYSNAGFSLWTSNHRLTFDYFPQRSIDDAGDAEWHDVPVKDRLEFEAIQDPQGLKQTRWYWARGIAFIEAHPWLTLKRAVYKVWIGFSPVFSPAKGSLFQTVYFLSYFPILVLSLVGAWRSRDQWRDLGYIYMLVLSFMAGTAIFWAHTSHRMYLEPCLMILAGAAVLPTQPVSCISKLSAEDAVTGKGN